MKMTMNKSITKIKQNSRFSKLKWLFLFLLPLFLMLFSLVLFTFYNLYIKSLYHNPLRIRRHKDLIEKEGFSFEEHKIITEDGYINTAWRIGSPTKADNNNDSRLPIVFSHGLLDNSFSFLALGRDFSLPYLFCEKGYDVWLVNSRGSTFSYEHMEKEKDSFNPFSNYWDFTFYELAKYDLMASIEYIKRQTNKEKLHYIGHSQGGFQLMFGYILNSEYLEKSIEKFVSLGTVVKFINIEKRFPVLLHKSGFLNRLYDLGLGNIMSVSEYNTLVFKYFCKYALWFCQSVIQSIIELEPTNQIDYSDLFDYFSFQPGGSSIKNLIHWLQSLENHSVSYFDYGKKGNQVKYGKETPDVFDVSVLSNMKIKTMLVKGKKDPYIPHKSIDFMRNLIKNSIILEVENYNHLDYLWAKSAKEKIYDKIVSFIDE